MLGYPVDHSSVQPERSESQPVPNSIRRPVYVHGFVPEEISVSDQIIQPPYKSHTGALVLVKPCGGGGECFWDPCGPASPRNRQMDVPAPDRPGVRRSHQK